MFDLYSMDDCPWCDILKQRLNHKKIEYKEIKDEELIREKGFETVPRLDVNGEVMDFAESIAWVNGQKI